MRQIRVAIIEDEPLARRRLRRLLRSIPDVVDVGGASDAVEAMTLIRDADPDVLLLDVQMPGMTGLQLIEQLDAKPAIVFVTAYEDYAVQAFAVHAVDYLVKPVSRERLVDAIERARQWLVKREAHDAVLYHRIGSRLRSVSASEIEFFEARGDYVAAWGGDGYVLLGTTLKDLEGRLSRSRFMRIHRSIIVNRRFVVEVRPHPGGRLRLLLSSGRSVVASRRRTPATRTFLRDQDLEGLPA